MSAAELSPTLDWPSAAWSYRISDKMSRALTEVV